MSSVNFLLRALKFSQSLQEQVVIFSSVIILSEKKIYLFQHFSFHNLFDLVHGDANTFTLNVTSQRCKYKSIRCTTLRSSDFRSPENLIFPAMYVYSKNSKNTCHKEGEGRDVAFFRCPKIGPKKC